MRRLFLLTLCLALIPAAAYSVTWLTADRAEFAWNPVTQLSGNGTIPESDLVEYRVFLAPNGDKDQARALGVTNATSYTVKIEQEGRHLLGVQTLRKDGNGTLLNESATVWSDDQDAVQEDPFGLQYYHAPATAQGLRRQ